MEPTVFTRLLEKTPYNLLRIAAYPRTEVSGNPETGFQGVGPHKDGSFLTFLLQGTGHSSLEVQNKAGEWIAAPPMENTLVVNIGRSLETLTRGVLRCNHAPSHSATGAVLPGKHWHASEFPVLPEPGARCFPGGYANRGAGPYPGPPPER